MSILNAWIESERAVIAVDTEAALPSGTAGVMSKLVTLPHIGAALAIRGNAFFFTRAFSLCHLFGGDFDWLDANMQAAVQCAFAEYLQTAEQLQMDTYANRDEQELVLVGWSEKRGRLWGRSFIQRDRARGFVEADIDEYHLSPWDVSFEPIGMPRDSGKMLELASAQVSFLRNR